VKPETFVLQIDLAAEVEVEVSFDLPKPTSGFTHFKLRATNLIAFLNHRKLVSEPKRRKKVKMTMNQPPTNLAKPGHQIQSLCMLLMSFLTLKEKR